MSGLTDADEKLFAEIRAALHIATREGLKPRAILVGPPMDGLFSTGPNPSIWGIPVKTMKSPGAGVVTTAYKSPL